MRIPTFIGIAALMLAGGPRPAAGQVIDGPPGAIGGFFGGHHPINPNRNAQTLEVSVDLSGGYDHDPNAFPADASGLSSPLSSWFGSTGTVLTRYRVGHLRRSLEARGRGLVNYQSNTSDALAGGEVAINGINRFGRRALNQLSVSVQSSYEPGWVFGAINPDLDEIGDAPPLDLAPQQGIIEERWLATSGTGGYTHYWEASHQSSLSVGGGRVKPLTDTGVQSEWQNASLAHNWTINPSFSVTGSYRYDRSRQIDPLVDFVPVQYQTLDTGVRLTRRMSSTRRLNLSLSGGATRIMNSGEFHPVMATAVEFVPSRFWAMSVQANRSVSVLSGVSATPMVSDSLDFDLSGTLMRRLRVTATGSYLHATSVIGPEDAPSFTRGTGATVEVRYGVARWWGAFVTYSFYRHRTDDPSLAAAGVPPIYDRHSARVGLTFWLPLYGAF